MTRYCTYSMSSIEMFINVFIKLRHFVVRGVYSPMVTCCRYPLSLNRSVHKVIR